MSNNFQIEKLTECFLAIADFAGRDMVDQSFWEEKLNGFESAIHILHLIGDHELIFEANQTRDAFSKNGMNGVNLDIILQLLREKIRRLHGLEPTSQPMKFIRLQRFKSKMH